MNQVKFFVDNSADINSNDLINLRTFYSPIIGSLGITFYHHLFDLYNINKLKKHDLYETSEFLLLDYFELEETKNKLEGLGLIKTFQDKDGNLLFKLIKPLNANEISNNCLIANILKNKIGEIKFNELIKQHAVYYFDNKNMNDVSKTFFDVFNCDKNMLKSIETFDFTLVNEDELLNTLSSEEYIFNYTKRELSPSQILMLKKIKLLNFDDKAINCFIKYSISVNNSIVCNYILKIADDFAKRNLFEAELIDNELSQVINFKNNTSINFATPKFKEISHNLDDGLSWDD
ncbi:DnaD domain protein [Metamycoplasma gateae]|uniref:DnaD domain protein n=1 Tax=Metamycoplasma gateae TaxID=35769 RepID=A0ABZ2AGD6_9BACT|nr:DnaD domain protein [Metamycoplasma gateae]